jgi:hypothetical protein
MKRSASGLRLRGPRLNERCIVAMVGDGINDAPVRILIASSAHYFLHGE